MSKGFSLLETLLFLGIAAIMSTTIIAVYISSQDARVRQQSIAAVEQRGALMLQQITRRIQRAEAVLTPVAGSSGAILALQSGINAEFPTIFTTSGSNVLMIEKIMDSNLLPGFLTVENLRFRHVDTGNIVISFNLSTVIPTPSKPKYRRHFETVATIAPDDRLEAGGCGSCPAPVCTSHQYRWYYCSNDACTQSSSFLAC